MQQNSPIKQRILEYLDFKGISRYKFYNESGMTRGVLDKDSGISEDNIAKFVAYFPKINLRWLMLGEGNITDPNVKDYESMVNEPQVYKLRSDKNHLHQSIPLYNLEASAGLVSLFQHQGDEKPIDYISIPNLPKCDGAVSVTGDSMYPLLKSGDIVMYKELNNEISNIFYGEMYLVSIDLDGDEYVSVKWIQRSDKGEEYVKLVSENQHHQPKDVPLKKVRALALVKASVRINSMR